VKKSFFISGTANSDVPTWEQFEDLVSFMDSQGFTLSKSLPADFLISMNYSSSDYASFIRTGGDPRHAALVLLEPRAVYPIQYTERVLAKYALVLKPGNPSTIESLIDFIGWPYEVNANPLHPTNALVSLSKVIEENHSKGLFEFDHWRKRKDHITMINSNKVSSAPIENYSLRRRFAREINPSVLGVYGDLWNSNFRRKVKHRIQVLFVSVKQGQRPILKNVYGDLHMSFPSSRGLVSDKHLVLQESKFNLVIENDPDYVSEKLFDSMINGCIPLYFGPKIPSFIVPEDCYIKISKQPDQLLLQLNQRTSNDFQKILFSMHNFLRSPEFITTWEKTHVFSKLGKEISHQFGATL
jgi:hypothetical protein